LFCSHQNVLAVPDRPGQLKLFILTVSAAGILVLYTFIGKIGRQTETFDWVLFAE